nr:glucan biosynthesis protein [Sphingomonas bacterium]
MIVTARRGMLGMIGALPMLGLVAAGPAAPAFGRPRPFSWTILQRKAAALAARPYRPRSPVAAAFDRDFDTAGAIRYRPDATIGDAVRLFPLSRTAAQPVQIALVEGGTAREIPFAPGLFDVPAGVAEAHGLAGFRVLNPGRDSDWLAFLGASYFRTAGGQDQYGLSARAIAIDTGIDGKEEFPAFTAFWIEPFGRSRIVVHALLDGPSVTGAFRFDCRLGADGVVQDVASVLHMRRDVARLGIAPATSMFWYGEGDRAAAIDWRPEIHDSDGLAMLTGAGERIWRPLVNPRTLMLNSFVDRDPKGFGLLQRDRAFDHYQDDGAFYDRRPNLWVEPAGRWGAGSVMLYAFPTRGETDDNVVAFWNPADAPRAGARLAFDYRLTWSSRDPTGGGVARAVATRTGTGGRPGEPPRPGQRKLVIDFAGAGLAGLGRQSGVDCNVEVAGGRLVEAHAYPIVGQAEQWRATIDVAPAGAAPAEVRLWLGRGGAALSETIVVPIG